MEFIQNPPSKDITCCEDIYKCSCIKKYYVAFKNYILKSKYNNIYKKIKNKQSISDSENTSFNNFIKNILDKEPFIGYDKQDLFKDCIYQRVYTSYQEYDEFGPIDEGDQDIYNCYERIEQNILVNSIPSLSKLVILAFKHKNKIILENNNVI